jgi:curli biogenesis system outer membrane secretion channel CsgG
MLVKKRFYCVCIIGFFALLGLTNLTLAAEKPTIAVFDFTVSETVTGEIRVETSGDTGRVSRVTVKKEYTTSLLTDKLVTALTNSKKVSVVERKKLDSLRQETQLTQAGLTDPKKSVEFGKLLGADYFLLGSLSMLDGKVAFEMLPYNLGQQKITELLVGADIRIVDTETGKIIAAKSEKVKQTKRETNPTTGGNNISVEFQHEVYDELVRRLVARVMDTLFPIKVAYFSNGLAYLNRGGLEEGTQYEIVSLGETIRDPDSGEIIGQAETKLAIVKVTRGTEKMSTAEVLQWFTTEKNIPEGSLCRLVLPGEAEDSKKEQTSQSIQ